MNRSDRKKYLIAQGAIYRTEALLAKQALQESQPLPSLGGGILPQIALAAFSLLRNRNSAGLPRVALQAMLPLVTGIASVLAKRKSIQRSAPLFKAVLRGAAVAGIAAGMVRFLSKKKKTASEAPGAEA